MVVESEFSAWKVGVGEEILFQLPVAATFKCKSVDC